MDNDKFLKILIFVLVGVLFAVNYPFIDAGLESFFGEYANQQSKIVARIIDGDTVEIETGEHVRLLGINSPERGEKYYSEAKEFLEDEILNETVILEFVGARTDKYGRILAYVFLNGKNMNIEMVRNGFANYYFYEGEDKYSNDLREAWGECLQNEINLCARSGDVCATCISISRKDIVNNCGFDCNVEEWRIEEEGRDEFVFDGAVAAGSKKSFNLDTSDSGGSLFLRDDLGKLVVYSGGE